MTRLIDDLVDALEPAPVRPALAVFGALLALASLLPLAVVAFVYGLRPDMGTAMAGPVFWVKLAVPGIVAAGAGIALARLSRPGAPPGPGLAIAILAMLGLLTAGLISIAILPEELRVPALMGPSLQKCLVSISVFGVPFLAAGFWAMRRLAPVQPRLAGFALGLVAGGLAAAVYALSCGEDALAFIASWYQLGMLIVASAGALIAPRLLRW